MIRYDLRYKNSVASVILNAKGPDQSAPIQYEGSPEVVSLIKDWLPSAYGAFGHLIGERTTPIDLKVAMLKLPKGWTIAASMGDIPETIRANIPDGAMT